jgi:hypothetical protein
MRKEHVVRALTWAAGGILAMTVVPLFLVVIALPFVGRVAFALQASEADLASAPSGAASFLAAASLSNTTVEATTQTETAKVTGGGTILERTRSFGFVAQGLGTNCDATGCDATGHLNYVNHLIHIHINGVVTRLVVVFGPPTADGRTTGHATFTGTDRFTGCTFTVNTADNGEPGTRDTFGLDCTSGETTGGEQTLSGGNIQIHPTQAP